MSDIQRTFHQKGAVVVMKTTVQDREFTSKDILEQITQLESSISQNKVQKEQLITQQEQLEEAKAQMDANLKNISKFKEWAETVQRSKFKAISEEIAEECKKQVEESYKNDPTLDEAANKRQMFAQYQRKIGTHPKMATEVANIIMRKEAFTDCTLKNPWQ